MSTHEKGMHPGAVWRKVDLQIHTPRDPQWQGSPHLPGGTDATEIARAQWADNFVDECLNRGLSAIAITDHHDACMVNYVKIAIDRRFPDVSPIWLFPGMEVTCRDAVQCLVLFDSETEPALWRRLFGGHLQNIDEPGLDDATNPQATQCGKDIEAFIESVMGDSKLAERCIILPHASNDGAHKSMLRQGFAPRFAQLPFDGVYTDKPFDGLQDGVKRKIYGEVADWGRRRRGIIPTGDNRHADYARLGNRPCWIRLGEPTVEALRQAVLADTARIAYQQPTLPSHRILSLHVSSSLTGATFSVSFNDGFNSIIGGRGSGKSSVLEYLRFGLGRSAIDTSNEEDVRQRDQALIEQTLEGGFVAVDLERDGVRERWTRNGDTREQILVTCFDGTGPDSLTIDAAQQRFRARAFYQKQLSTIVLDRERAAEQITGIAAAEVVDKRRVVEREIAAAQRAVQSAYQKVIEFWLAENQHAQSEAAVADLVRRRDAVGEKIQQFDLSLASRKAIEEAPTYRLARALLHESNLKIAQDMRTLEKTAEALTSVSTDGLDALAAEFEELVPMLMAARTAKQEFVSGLSAALAALHEFSRASSQSSVLFERRFASFERRHEAAVREQSAAADLLQEAARLDTEFQTATASERSSRARMIGLADATTGLEEARAALSSKVGELSTILGEAATQVEIMSGGTLRAHVSKESRPLEYVQAYAQLFEGNRIRDVQSKCELRAEALATNQGAWDAVCNELLDVRRIQIKTGSIAGELPAAARNSIKEIFFEELTPQQSKQVYEKINDFMVTRFLCAITMDFISFEYKDGKQFIPFAQASPGQQASALLNLLLNQEAGTLIIDQPEDDLDNKVIMSIAQLLQVTKRRRQLIFATHNPNLVVNGDADKIIALRPGFSNSTDAADDARITIQDDGAIETPSIRDAVTEIMEGGKEAFELRSRKYSF
ncbi:AAA family ATPase [Ensifer sesbaniae]|uniref:TrlF family AAA-like ATPase n=1 Tax=Ensifer sesbaniae TaxID=1214071 RepID=UPI002001C279|nr:AAA family ATPase [Ensifer sesbaniae]